MNRFKRAMLSFRSPALLLAVIFGALLLAVLGLLLLRGSSIAAGMILIALAIGAFLLASRQLESITSADLDVAAHAQSWLPVGLLGIGFFSCIVATYEVAQPRTLSANQLSFAFWLAGLICLIGGTLWLEHWQFDLHGFLQKINENRREILLVGGVFLLALCVRLYVLDLHPFPWSGDEASVGLEARRILSGENTDAFNTGWSGQPNLSFIPPAIALAIFGGTFLALRVVSALVGALSIVTLYLLGRELFDRRTAAIAAAFLTTFPLHLQFSRIGVSNIFDAFMVTLVLWLVVRALHRESLRSFMWAGIATGLGLYTYIGSRLVIALAVGTVAYFLIRQRSYLRAHLRHMAFYASGVLLTVGPMAFFMLRHPDIFMTRLAQTGILFNGWLPNEAVKTGRSMAAILLDQVQRSTLVYVSQNANGNFFNSPQPYLTIFGSIFFLIGMGYAFQQLLKFPFTILLAWFWSVVVLGGVLTLDPPANTRLVMTAPAVALLVALGVEAILRILSRLKIPARWVTVTGAVVAGALLVQNGVFYFGPYRTGNYFSDANSEMAQAVGLELQSLGPTYSLYMMGQPRLFAGFPTIAFLAPKNSRVDVDATRADALDLTNAGPVLLVATPDNVTALQSLSRRYPGGKWESVPRTGRPEFLYYAYILGGNAASQNP